MYRNSGIMTSTSKFFNGLVKWIHGGNLVNVVDWEAMRWLRVVLVSSDRDPTAISSVAGVAGGLLPLPPLLNAAVAEFCKKTDYPEQCQSSAQHFLPAVGEAKAAALVDTVAFLKVQMAACRAKAEAAQSSVAALLKQPGMNPMVASTLQVCDDSYSDAFDNLDATDKAVEARDKGTINSMLSALVDDFSTCEDGFTEMQDASPLAAFDGALSKLASNCLAIADLI
ncbi:hypothetical protein ZIOFF_005649 [Zingiber officinale]|uniref:Pectinesterase inhibitor domain-containing protein n=1 Tax=Zingiber officinale TaxID=94328 RepID=A0A8J5M4G5_ZINOF|nr:hypothetical protein ZIOFF_005649 [Zingiber officinale]